MTKSSGNAPSSSRTTRLLGLLLLAAAFAPVQAGAAASRPDSYAEFDTSVASSDGSALKTIIEAGATSYIFVRRGAYVLDNPVVIDRGTSLFVHGADRMHTVLIAKNPALPLFVVQRAPLVNFAGLSFIPTRDSPHSLNARAISTENTEPLAFEMLDCAVGHAMLTFAGPGRYQIQTPSLSPGGRVRASIWVDHPDADVLVFAGDASNGLERLRTLGDFAFVWQRRGRIRVHSTTFEASLGQGDVRIESESWLGPHVIANVRSEGVSGALVGTGARSRFLYVPPTTERVDVLLKANGGAWATRPLASANARLNCAMISYGAAGTVWLLGNRAEGWCGHHIAEGSAPDATIVSVGNLISSPEPFAISAKRIITAGDLFNHSVWTLGDQTYPVVRWIPDGSPAPKLSSYSDVPPVPDDELPSALLRPRLDSAMPGMIDVTSAPYGALGDGTTDDTQSIQKALDAHCDGATPKAIFFPEGTYRITRTLYLNHHSGGSCRRRPTTGGWIAGAGSASTILAMDPDMKMGTFATDGLAYATVQGITFKTWAWRTGDPEVPNVDLEFYPGSLATQQNNFYDVVFDGGFGGLAIGVKHPTGAQCSSIVLFDGEIRNTHIGLISGHYNALANGVVASRLIDNDYALGSWTDLSNQGTPPEMPPGGTFFAYNSVSRGSRVQDFRFAGSANGSMWYFYDYDSDAPRFFVSRPTSAPWPIMFDSARLAPRPGAEYLFDVASSMGPIFLNSRVTRSAIRIGQTSMGQSYAIQIQSEIGDWSDAVAPNQHGQTDSMD
jgi:hypothetical protein